MKNPHAVALGKKGGQVTGPCKARSREQCQAAANKRWAKYRLTHGKKHQPRAEAESSAI